VVSSAWVTAGDGPASRRITMHHFRGQLLDGDQIRLDPADVYLQFHALPGDPGRGWYGYLLVASESDVEPGRVYTLRLSDGRSGRLRIEHVTPDDSGKFRATFVGEGSLK
jgi:hypothetical protein